MLRGRMVQQAGKFKLLPKNEWRGTRSFRAIVMFVICQAQKPRETEKKTWVLSFVVPTSTRKAVLLFMRY
jgi:hypothetical protein